MPTLTTKVAPPVHMLICIWCLLCCIWTPLHSAQAKDISPPVRELQQGPTLTVQTVGYGASFDLTNGKRVRLLGIRVPKPDTPSFHDSAEPLGAKAKAFVEKFLHGHSITLYFDRNRNDRYKRWLAHIVRDDGIWLQQALLEAGLARVYSFPDNRWGIETLLSFEDKARHEKRGIWALPYFNVQTPDTIGHHIGTFQIVEGRVTAQNRGKGTIYLNFGPNWKTDFTVRILKKYRRAFTTDHAIPQYAGKHIRVRGWVKKRNGPLIDLTHPEQIEILNQPFPHNG